MAEVDPVILDLIARNGKYNADIRQSTTLVQNQLGRQEKAVQRLERQMQRSSTAIGGTLRGLAGTIATYFTGRELVGLIDGFTRLQNSLKVAGIEGEDLARTQADLLDLSTRYGVSIESLADLFGKAAQSGKDLGASQAQILQLTEATSQALLITGTSSQQASGAILGLTQALASGTVRAEEFNQINEGGLRPLLQAAAASEKYGGSVAKLRAAVIDGKVSSQEFYQSILAGSAQLEGQASKATLTLSGAFAALTSALTVYVGESAKANGATQALAGGIKLLADNIDVLIPALAVLATALGVGLVTNAIRARIALLAASGAAVTLGTASAAAGRAMLAAFGGPVGVAITALVLGMGYLVSETVAASEAARQAELQAKKTTAALDAEEAATDSLTKAKGRERAAMIASMQASRARALQALQTAKALRAEATAALAVARQQASSERRRLEDQATFGGSFGATELGAQNIIGTKTSRATAKAERELARADANIAELEGVIEGIGKALDTAAAPVSLPTVDGKSTKSKKGPKDRTEELAARAAQDLANLQIEELRARAQLTTDTTERAEIEREILAKERDARNADIDAAVKAGDLTKEQAAAQREIVDKLYGKSQTLSKEGDILVEAQNSLYREQVEREKRLQDEQDRADIAEARFRSESDALRQQYDLAETQAERRDLAYKIIDLEYRYRDAQLQAVIDNEDIAKAVRERAQIEQAALRAAKGRTIESARRDTAGPLENYFDNAKKDAAELNELYEQIAVDGLQSLNDGLADAIVNSKSLGDVFKNVAKQIIADLIRIAIQQVIVNSLMSAFGGGGGGGIGSLLSGGASGAGLGIGGLASGGYAEPHSIHRVNEHKGGVELLRMGSRGGTVIPLGQVNAQAAQPSAQPGVATVRLMLSDDIDGRIVSVAGPVAVEVVKASIPSTVETSVSETLRRANRPRV